VHLYIKYVAECRSIYERVGVSWIFGTRGSVAAEGPARRSVSTEILSTTVYELKKLSFTDERGPTDQFRTETLSLTLTLICDVDTQIRTAMVMTIHTQKVKVKLHSVQKLEWKQTDGRRRLRYLPC